jgi:hypothetical protein
MVSLNVFEWNCDWVFCSEPSQRTNQFSQVTNCKIEITNCRRSRESQESTTFNFVISSILHTTTHSLPFSRLNLYFTISIHLSYWQHSFVYKTIAEMGRTLDTERDILATYEKKQRELQSRMDLLASIDHVIHPLFLHYSLWSLVVLHSQNSHTFWSLGCSKVYQNIGSNCSRSQ